MRLKVFFESERPTDVFRDVVSNPGIDGPGTYAWTLGGLIPKPCFEDPSQAHRFREVGVEAFDMVNSEVRFVTGDVADFIAESRCRGRNTIEIRPESATFVTALVDDRGKIVWIRFDTDSEPDSVYKWTIEHFAENVSRSQCIMTTCPIRTIPRSGIDHVASSVEDLSELPREITTIIAPDLSLFLDDLIHGIGRNAIIVFARKGTPIPPSNDDAPLLISAPFTFNDTYLKRLCIASGLAPPDTKSPPPYVKDEDSLPGTLRTIGRIFRDHPPTDRMLVAHNRHWDVAFFVGFPMNHPYASAIAASMRINRMFMVQEQGYPSEDTPAEIYYSRPAAPISVPFIVHPNEFHVLDLIQNVPTPSLLLIPPSRYAYRATHYIRFAKRLSTLINRRVTFGFQKTSEVVVTMDNDYFTPRSFRSVISAQRSTEARYLGINSTKLRELNCLVDPESPSPAIHFITYQCLVQAVDL